MKKANTTYPVCEKCGSRNIRKDAWAEWDDTAQCWVLDNAFDNCYCMECEDETDIEWKSDQDKISIDTAEQHQDQRPTHEGGHKTI